MKNKKFDATEGAISCDIIGHPDIGDCMNTEGPHLAQFFVYFLIRGA